MRTYVESRDLPFIYRCVCAPTLEHVIAVHSVENKSSFNTDNQCNQNAMWGTYRPTRAVAVLKTEINFWKHFLWIIIGRRFRIKYTLNILWRMHSLRSVAEHLVCHGPSVHSWSHASCSSKCFLWCHFVIQIQCVAYKNERVSSHPELEAYSK
jgi:hypothetical protein